MNDATLDRSAGDSWERYGFFGISVFGAPEDDLVALSHSSLTIRRRSQVRTARCGALRAAGFHVAATFANPRHYSVVLPDVTPEMFALLRSCFSPPVENPGFAQTIERYHHDMSGAPIDLWVDDHQEYEPGVVHGHLRHARVVIDPHPGDYLVVGDDEAPPVLAEVLSRQADGELLLRLLPGPPQAHDEFVSRRVSTGI